MINEALRAVDDMANRLDEIDGMYSWEAARHIIQSALTQPTQITPRMLMAAAKVDLDRGEFPSISSYHEAIFKAMSEAK